MKMTKQEAKSLVSGVRREMAVATQTRAPYQLRSFMDKLSASAGRPLVYWHKHAVGNDTRYRLYVDGKETLFWISKERYYDQLGRYSLCGSGLDTSGSALRIKAGQKLKGLKEEAVALALAARSPAESRLIDDVRVTIGAIVAFRRFQFGGPHRGTIAGLTASDVAYVRWDEEEQPRAAWLPALKLVEV
jgi:hypothetical protein